MISITFNFTDVAQAAALFSRLTGSELASATVTPAAAPATVEVLAARTEATPTPKSSKPTKAPAPDAPTAPSSPTAEAAPSPAPAAPAPSTSVPAAATPTAAPAAAPSAPAEITYQDLSKAVLTLHKLDATAAVPIAKSLGAATFKLLQPTQWAEAHRLVTEAIAARS